MGVQVLSPSSPPSSPLKASQKMGVQVLREGESSWKSDDRPIIPDILWGMRCLMKIRMTLSCRPSLHCFEPDGRGCGEICQNVEKSDAQPTSWKGKKVAAFVLTVMNHTRQGAEQALARELTQRGAQGVPGYTVVPQEAQKDREAAKRILADAGITGLPAGGCADQEMVATAGTAYYLGPSVSTLGHRNYGWSMAYAPGTVNNKTTLMVETPTTLSTSKPLWDGTGKRTNPRCRRIITKPASAVGNEVKKAGLVSR